MVASYKCILEKIQRAEKKLNSPKTSILKGQELAVNEKNGILKQNDEVIEEIRSLKENISEVSHNNHSMAYQPVTVKVQDGRSFK